MKNPNVNKLKREISRIFLRDILNDLSEKRGAQSLLYNVVADSTVNPPECARMAELADALDSKSSSL